MPEAEPNDAPMSANLAADMPFDCTGTISYGGDWDFIKVNLTAGQPTQFDVYHRIGYFNTPLDPMLYVVAENGSTILYVDDDISFPTNLNSEVRFSAPYTGTYYLGIRSAVMAGGPGYDYIVSGWTSLNPVFDISNAEVEPNDTSAVADPVTIPGVKIGAMNYPGDADWTVFSADGGTTIVVDVHSVIYRFLMDPVAEVYDAYGHRLCMNDDMDSRDSRVNILIPASGVYFLKISDYTSGSGMGYFYIVSVTPQFGTGAPTITQLKFKPAGMLKKVVGTGFNPAGTYVEVDSHVIPAQVSAAKPTTVMKVKPTYPLPPNSVVTTVLQNGRRSNPALYTGS